MLPLLLLVGNGNNMAIDRPRTLKTMDNDTRERIEKEAEELVSKSHGDKAIKAGRKKWYIAGATAEHHRAWNEAIDACKVAATKYIQDNHPLDISSRYLNEELEALKGKQQ